MSLRTLSRFAFAIALLALLFGSLVSERQLGFSVSGYDKVVHIAGYFALAILGALGWPQRRMIFLLALPLLGVGLEAAQTLTPDRQFSWQDALANGAGIGLGVAFSVWLTRWTERKAR